MSVARIVERAIEPVELIREVADGGKGAISVFLGTVRDTNEGRQVASLNYSAYSTMAQAELLRVLDEVLERFGVCSAVVEHRIGPLKVGDVSIGIAMSHEHRAPAMAAVTYAIEEIKRRVPIWKKEEYVDGTREWVEPAAAQPDSRAVR